MAAILDEPEARSRVFVCNSCYPAELGRLAQAAEAHRDAEAKLDT
jgi:hypothetical protein